MSSYMNTYTAEVYLTGSHQKLGSLKAVYTMSKVHSDEAAYRRFRKASCSYLTKCIQIYVKLEISTVKMTILRQNEI